MKQLTNLKIEHKCDECNLRTEEYFCSFRDITSKVFESLTSTRIYPKGKMLFMEGENATGVYMLCQGRVKLSTCSKDGKVIILHIAEPGEILGLSALVTDSIHVATAEVIESCQINFVRNDDFLNFLKNNAEACVSAVKQLGKNYNTAFLQICSLGLSASVSDKLATLFLGWCKASVESIDGVHLKISYTHEEIAEMIGTSRETVTRLLKDFKKQHLITKKGSSLIIHDKKKMEAIIGTKPNSKL
jgi:CRP/FNR family transcriptional regulator, cyclic AMP receptor protein